MATQRKRRIKEPEVNPAALESEKDYRAAPVIRAEHKESSFTLLLEQQAAKVPSDVFLFLALGAMTGSAIAEFSGRPRLSRFVGQWAPTLLIMGVYNKLVKTIGPH